MRAKKFGFDTADVCVTNPKNEAKSYKFCEKYNPDCFYLLLSLDLMNAAFSYLSEIGAKNESDIKKERILQIVLKATQS